MVKNIFDSILGKSPARSEEDYMELDLAAYEVSSEEEPASMYVKIATIADLRIHRVRRGSTTATSSSSISAV